MRGIARPILFLVAAALTASVCAAAPPRPVSLLRLSGAIDVPSQEFLERGLKVAQGNGSQLLVVVINTPGGLGGPMEGMTQALLNAPIPTAAFVYPAGGHAWSAGTFITMAAGVAAMNPGTTVGAAHPISLFGATPPEPEEGKKAAPSSDAMAKKIENAFAEQAKVIASVRHRNTAWAEKAVRESRTASAQEAGSNRAKFRLKYAPHFGMFKNSAGDDPIAQLKFAADQGFPAWEDNGMMGRPVDLQEKVAQTMQQLGMTMGVFSSSGGFDRSEFTTSTSKDLHERLRAQMKKAVEVAQRVNTRRSTFTVGNISQKLERDYQMANAAENLRVCAEVCEPAGLVLVLEPLNWWHDHPGLFLTKVPQAYLLCKAVHSPSIKILDDLYHQQISEGNLIPNMDLAWDEIGYFQIGDNPGRNEPTTGEINYRNVFKHIHEKGYTGVLGMEHGVSRPGREGEMALIEAYRYCDSF